MNRLLCALFLTTLFAGPALADFEAGSKTIAIFGGIGGSSTQYDYQPGTEEHVTTVGGAFGAQALYYLKGSPAIGLGVDLANSMNGTSDSDDLLAGYNSQARTKTFAGLAIARLSYPKGLFRPYLFVGLGMHHTTQKLSAEPQAGVVWPGGGTERRMIVDDSASSFALGYGLGMDLFFNESFFIGTELRGTSLAGLDTDETDALKNAGFTLDEKNGLQQGNIFIRTGFKF